MELINERVLPYAEQKLSTGHHVVNGYFGGWALLSSAEFKRLKQGTWHENDTLHGKLKQAGIVLSDKNMQQVISRYTDLQRSLFMKPSLHIINVTNVCNQRCTYCHAGVSQGSEKMDLVTAAKVVKFILENSSESAHVEFQGGECLLNWDVVKLITEKLRELNAKIGKNLLISVVSNLSHLDEEKMHFLLDHDVGICTSLDGPRDLHNHYRKLIGGQGSYDTTIEKVQMVKDELKRRGKDPFVGMLATMGRAHLEHPEAIIDEYVRLGVNEVHLRPLNSLGDALSSWDTLSYSAEDYIIFWKRAMDYVLKLNKEGKQVYERGAHIKLRKILGAKDALYVDMMSPTGSGRAVLLYNFDGDIYTCDEGRMYPDDTFKIGHVDMDAKEVFGNDDLLGVWSGTFLDLTCYHCPYRSYCGTSPVINYQQRKNPIPNIMETFWHKVHHAQFTYIFEQLAKGGEEKEIFIRWVQQGKWV